MTLLLAILLLGGPLLPGAAPDFEREIRPIFEKNCYRCHGPKDQKNGYRLDQRSHAMKGGDSGKRAIVPEKPEESRLIALVAGGDPELKMPPRGKPLTSAEVDLLRAWVKGGAPWPDALSGESASRHWAYVAPVRLDPPVIAHPDWARNPIDSFIAARFEKEGLAPSPEAEPATLLRRASLDLTGLPPNPEEVDAFLSDSAPGAYERAIDRLLASPAYGERWARLWLDLARYADSQGYEKDNLRTIWRYRDWVIEALNRDLPFDQFTIEQLAGDLLPSPTLDQKVATAFHRNTMTNTEGGTDDEEFRTAAVVDRVNTTFEVWMGTTMGCAQCHSHKYDPLTQKEYYQALAFFNSTEDADRDDDSPLLPAPTSAEEKETQRLTGEIERLRHQLAADNTEVDAAQAEWERGLAAGEGFRTLPVISMSAASGATLEAKLDGSILVSGANPANDTYTVTARGEGKPITALRLEALLDDSLPARGPGRASDGNFVLSRLGITAGAGDGPPVRARRVRIQLPGPQRILSLAEVELFHDGVNIARGGKAAQSSVSYEGAPERAIDGNPDGNFDARSTTHTATENDPWWEVDLGSEIEVDSISIWNRTDSSPERLTGLRLQLFDDAKRETWTRSFDSHPAPRLEVALRGPSPVEFASAAADHSQNEFPVENALRQKDLKKSGWAVAPQMGQLHQAYFFPRKPIDPGAAERLTIRLEHSYRDGGFNLGRFRIAATADPGAPQRYKLPPAILAVLAKRPEERSGKEKEELRSHFRSIAPSLAPLRDKLAEMEKALPRPSTVPVIRELPKPRSTHILIRGNFLNRGDEVTPGVPAVFPPLPEGPPNRLTFARWLVDPRNPLTARVLANRIWEQCFGRGIVETIEDFGTRGEPPSHPELLDWLATEIVREGWSLKKFQKLLVTSAAYRQTSRATPELLAKDPQNRLLARGPRVRLDAEAIRDQALAVSGLLSRKIGGPSVMPPQPEGIWSSPYSGDKWMTSAGEDRYRRGIYTFWRRTAPYPSFLTFDARSRETCILRRSRSNTPLQALTLLNDPVYVEAAQALARRMLKEGGPGAAERVVRGFRLCVARRPAAGEVERLVAFAASEMERYRSDLAAARTMSGAPVENLDPAEMAAWTVVANVLLNLDEMITKG